MENYRIQQDASIYFVTYSVVSWLPVFVSGASIGIVTESLRFCHTEKGLRISAYVIMPTHLHMIVCDHEHSPDRLSRTLSEFRRFTGRALSDHCATHMPPAFSREFKDASGPDRKRRLWQPTRHPEAIQSQVFWEQKASYLHANPCRKGLALYPEDWRYSSARFYVNGSDPHSDVPVTPLVW